MKRYVPFLASLRKELSMLAPNIAAVAISGRRRKTAERSGVMLEQTVREHGVAGTSNAALFCLTCILPPTKFPLSPSTQP